MHMRQRRERSIRLKFFESNVFSMGLRLFDGRSEIPQVPALQGGAPMAWEDRLSGYHLLVKAGALVPGLRADTFDGFLVEVLHGRDDFENVLD